MVEFGYVLSSEEHGPNQLVAAARRAEEVGFGYAMISDHFHPWIERQGNSPFVWAVIGAIARETKRMRVGTGVTCPTFRIHPAIVAQAAATCATLLPARFFLGLGSGEYLNEHVTGNPWPPVSERHSRLEEAMRIIRLLWSGGRHSFYGHYYRVENARLFTLPPAVPPIYMSAHGKKALSLAGKIADGVIGVLATDDSLAVFDHAGGWGKPKIAEVKVCYSEDEKVARRTALEWWPTIGMGGQLSQDLALPSHYGAVAKLVTEDTIAERIACGPDPARHLEAIQRYVDAGYDHVTIHQVGPDQEGFFAFYADHLLPAL
jgi:coenzyme F420-dependent glucose-6-phosphate dehydrogenase